MQAATMTTAMIMTKCHIVMKLAGYQGTCFDSQDYDDVTGIVPCKDGLQVQNYRLSRS